MFKNEVLRQWLWWCLSVFDPKNIPDMFEWIAEFGNSFWTSAEHCGKLKISKKFGELRQLDAEICENREKSEFKVVLCRQIKI